MKHLALITALAMGAAPAMAQWNTTPNIYGHPEFGTTTTGPGGSYHTTPNIYGHPEYGTTTTGNGVRCTTTPNIYGDPGAGSSTRCN